MLKVSLKELKRRKGPSFGNYAKLKNNIKIRKKKQTMTLNDHNDEPFFLYL